MAAASRRAALCAQPIPARRSGIDFVRVADETQTVLEVFFVVDPSATRIAEGSSSMLSLPGSAFGQLGDVRIEGAQSAASRQVRVQAADWVTDAATGRTVLRVSVAEPGDFSEYRLTIEHPALDPFFRSVRFSFKQACPSDFDCRGRSACAEEPPVRVNVDYAARDFESLRSALLDFAAQRYPQWQERIPADGAVMLTEVLCALADEFSYMQDRMAREAHLATATQRRSLQHMARLVDYDVDQGQSATTLVSLTVADGRPLNVAASGRNGDRLVFWAPVEGGEPVPFEAIVPAQPDPHYGDDHFWVHPQWNQMDAEVTDAAAPCLPSGATSMYLAPMADGRSPLAATLDPGSARSEPENWLGRTLLLVADPEDPSRPRRAWAVTLTAVPEVMQDPLFAHLHEITKVTWSADQALPFELPLADTVVWGNNLSVFAGRTETKHVRTGDQVPDESRQLEQTIVRESARYEDELERTTSPRRFNRRIGLEHSIDGGLAFNADGTPFVVVEQVENAVEPATVSGVWKFRESLLDADEDAEVFTLESGVWAEVRRFERHGKLTRHADYASNQGFTILFGDGVFGANPASDIVLRVSYRLNPGSRGNVPSGVIQALAEPGTQHPALGGNYGEILACTNWLPGTGGRDPESADHISRFAPWVYRARPLRAVIDEDYRSILGRLSFAQAIGVNQRWTGSWLTRFLTADPRDRATLLPEQKAVLLRAGDSIRQVGRHVTAVGPVFRPLDLAIVICVETSAYFGQVKEAVVEALMHDGFSAQDNGLFHPDNFSFGTPLTRSSVEAVVQRVPGVLGVQAIWVRPQRSEQWREFTEDVLRIGAREIIQLRNDPRYPDQGTLTVRKHGSAAPVGCC